MVLELKLYVTGVPHYEKNTYRSMLLQYHTNPRSMLLQYHTTKTAKDRYFTEKQLIIAKFQKEAIYISSSIL